MDLRNILKESRSWKGEFLNYVKKHPATGQEGIVQKGEWEMEIETEGEVITLTNKFFDEEGNQTDYEGKMEFKIDGNKIIQLGDTDKDPNTGNPIKNYDFEGYIIEDHMYVREEYDEIMGDKKEHRRNTLNFHLLNDDEIMHSSDVYVDGELLVFGGIKFKRQ